MVKSKVMTRTGPAVSGTLGKMIGSSEGGPMAVDSLRARGAAVAVDEVDLVFVGGSRKVDSVGAIGFSAGGGLDVAADSTG